jgi:hypothetical protein
MSGVDGTIDAYIAKFDELLNAFQRRAVLQTEITVLRVMGDIEHLGE